MSIRSVVSDKNDGSSIALSRELLIALPDSETDLYRIHQLVWNHVAKATRDQRKRPEFIYRIDDGMIRVRSRDLPAQVTRSTQFRANTPVQIDLAAVWGSEHENAVPASHMAAWCTQKLESVGFEVQALEVTDIQTRTGFKFADEGVQNIKIPVARVNATLKITDPVMATVAWQQGVGRGKRFGLGMLTQ